MPYQLKLSNIPIIRILLPYVIGIVLSDVTELVLVGYFFILSGIILGLYYNFNKDIVFKYSHNYYSLISITLISFGIGYVYSYSMKAERIQSEITNYEYIIARTDPTKYKNESTKNIDIIAYYTNTGTIIPAKHGDKAQIHILNDSSITLGNNTYFCFPQEMRKIKNSSIPDAFNYKSYMTRNGILNYQYINLKDIRTIKYHDNSIISKSALLNDKINKAISQLSCDNETKDFLSAILLGNKTNLDEDVRSTFTNAGLAHILALSGLHIGIIAYIIYLLLYPLLFTPLRKSRLYITIVLLWIYAYITGCSPSVIRACIMSTLMIGAIILHRQNSSLNSLLFAILLMLIISPFQLYDVGFQLSVFAVLAILLFANYINIFKGSKSKIIRYFGSIMSISIAAQIGTAIPAAYYFHNFSYMFFVSNIIVLPLMPIIMSVAIFCIALILLGINLSIGGTLIDFLYHTIIDITSWLNSYGGYSSSLYIDTVHIIIYIAIVFSLYLLLTLRKRYFLYSLLSCVLLFIVYDIYLIHNHHNKYGIIVSDSRTNSCILLHNKENSYIVSEQDSISTNVFGNYIIKHGLNIPIVTNSINDIGLKISRPFFVINGKTGIIASTTALIKSFLGSNMTVDYAIITSHYYGKISDLVKAVSPKMIIICNDVYPKRAEKYEIDCKTLNIKCHNIHENGAYYSEID